MRQPSLFAILAFCMAPVTAMAEEGAAASSPIANWQTLEQFLQQPATPPVAQTEPVPDKPAGALLPSLGSERPPTPLLAPVAIKPVEFAALPPLFERPKPTPPMTAKKLTPEKKVLPQLVATIEKPQAPAKTEACAPPEMTKRAKNYASDSATLEALQQAVKELKLDERLDFMQPPKTSTPPLPAALTTH